MSNEFCFKNVDEKQVIWMLTPEISESFTLNIIPPYFLVYVVTKKY